MLTYGYMLKLYDTERYSTVLVKQICPYKKTFKNSTDWMNGQ